MAAWVPAPGETLLVPSGPGLHLFVLVLGPLAVACYGATPQVVMVNASSIKEGVPFDPACILEPGDHPFINRRSYVAYRHMRIDPMPHVTGMVAAATCAPNAACAPALLARVVAGVCQSRLTPREFKRIFNCPA